MITIANRTVHTLIATLFVLQNLLLPPAVSTAYNASAIEDTTPATSQNALSDTLLSDTPLSDTPLSDTPLSDTAVQADELAITDLNATDFPIAEPSVAASVDETPPAEESMGAPVQARLSTDKEFLLNGESAQLTVEVWRGDELGIAGASVVVTLPDQFKTTGKNKETAWTLPDLALDEMFTRVIDIKVVNAATPAAVVDVALRVTPPDERPTVQTQITMGAIPNLNKLPDTGEVEVVQGSAGTVLGAEDGEVVLLSPQGSVPTGTALRFKQLHKSYTSEPESNVTAAAQQTERTDLFLPLIFDEPGGTALLPARAFDSVREVVNDSQLRAAGVDGKDGNTTPILPEGDSISASASITASDSITDSFYHVWDFTAEQNGQEIESFEQPMLLVLDARWLEKEGVQPRTLGIYTRKNADAEWQSVPATYIEKRRVLVAKLSHFSEYALGLELNTKGDILPSVSSFSSDLSTGAATVSYPIEVPAGPGGMAPALSLSYSSNSVNDFYRANDASSSDYDAQASNVGLGWSLSGIGYIALADRYSIADLQDDQYSLILGDSSTEIRYEQMVPEQFISVSKNVRELNSNSATQGKARDAGTWTVRTKDGTKHIFGSMADPRTPVSNSKQGMIVDFTNKRWQVNKWYLAEQEDPMGNYMSYEYESFTRAIRPDGGNNCYAPYNETNNYNYNNAWYYRDIQPTSISWGGNKNTGHAHTMRLLFTYENRTDYKIKDWDERCVQAMYSQKRLKKMTVQVKHEGAWKPIRQYELTYQYTQGTKTHSSLTQIRHFGWTSRTNRVVNPLYTYSFGYTAFAHHAQRYLAWVSNGLGGIQHYTYQTASTTEYEIEHDKPGTVTATDTETYRKRVSKTKLGDGLGIYFYTTYGYGTSRQRLYRGSADYLGHDYVTTYTYRQNTNNLISANLVRQTEHWFHQLDNEGGGNPDPRMGREYQSMIWQPKSLTGSCDGRTETGGLCKMQQVNTTWTAATGGGTSWSTTSNYHARPRWIRLAQTVTAVDGVSNKEIYSYEASRQNNTQFGNVTRLQEWADGSLLRTSHTEYYPNTINHIVALPARQWITDASGTCHSDTRTIYRHGLSDKWTTGYKQVPNLPLVSKTDRARTACSSATKIGWYDANWQVTLYDHDAYGNQTVVNNLGTQSDGGENKAITTTYDGTYHRFPIGKVNSYNNNFQESARYWGVNLGGIYDGRGVWGAMGEACGVNNVCTRMAYDKFGRPTYQWINERKSDGFASTSSATTQYTYFAPGELSGLQTYLVTEWSHPRGEGNFVRRHYNGLGQLVQEQMPNHNWSAERKNIYSYDSLGNQNRASVPLAMGLNQFTNMSVNWGSTAHTTSTSDVLGRPVQIVAPNGETSVYAYANRAMSITAVGRNGEADRITKWTQTDGLGNLKLVRNYVINSSNQYVLKASVSLTHDVMGNLTQVQNAAGGSTSMSYNLVGEKLSMNDPDLGTWRYAYGRQGQLVRQTDARGKTTCMEYQTRTGRIQGKYFQTGTACNGSGGTYDIRYTYDDGSRGASRGQLTQVYYQKSTNYVHNYWYTDRGLLKQEQVRINNGGGQSQFNTYNTYYTYSGAGASYRLASMKYPDNDVVTFGYNSMGLQKSLHSSVYGTLVDQAVYDTAGRLTSYRMPRGTDIYRTQTYWPWTSGTSSNSNGRLKEIKVGTSSGAANRLYYLYGYDSFGNIGGMSERYDSSSASDTTTYTFAYDAQNRLTKAYDNTATSGNDGQTFAYRDDGRFTRFEGNARSTSNSFPLHAYKSNNWRYDANGNLTTRSIVKTNGAFVASAQTLTWNHENRLARVSGTGINGSAINETYLYNDAGVRVKKTSNGASTYYPFAHYHVENGYKVKYYSFNGQPVARYQANGNNLLYLHTDHLGSVALTTYSSNATVRDTQTYCAYGKQRNGTGCTSGNRLDTEKHFTGQDYDSTGLHYYNARYYDDHLGQFISPDTIVPDPEEVFDYNRYMYVRGNPIKHTDSSGHYLETALDIASLSLTVYDINQNGLNWENGIGLTADVASLALPGIAGGGTIVRKADEAVVYGSKAAKWLGDKADEGWQATKGIFGRGDDIAGSGLGRWTRHGEVVDASIVQQAEGNWCALACGEMLSNGRVTQQKLSELVDIMPGGTDPGDVAAAMNVLDPAASGVWTGGNVGLEVFGGLNSLGSWGAMMKIDGGHHMIVVDGVNDAGMVMIRDPYGATRYNMSLDEFMANWNGNAIFSQ